MAFSLHVLGFQSHTGGTGVGGIGESRGFLIWTLFLILAHILMLNAPLRIVFEFMSLCKLKPGKINFRNFINFTLKKI